MRFQDAVAEYTAHSTAAYRAAQAFDRTWLIRPEEPSRFEKGVAIRLYRSGWSVQDGVGSVSLAFRTTHADGSSRDDDVLDYSVDEFMTLASIRRTVDKWIAGEIDDLPSSGDWREPTTT